jgi:hypothetical protein
MHAQMESLAGQIAVAWTIRNRVNDGKAKSWWGEGYAGVCQNHLRGLRTPSRR